MCLLSSSCASPGPLLQDWGSKAFFRPSPLHLRCRAGRILLHKGLHHPSSGCRPMAPAPAVPEQDAGQAHASVVARPRGSPVSRAENAHNSPHAATPPQQQIPSGGTQGHPGVTGREATGPLQLQPCHPSWGSFRTTPLAEHLLCGLPRLSQSQGGG